MNSFSRPSIALRSSPARRGRRRASRPSSAARTSSGRAPWTFRGIGAVFDDGRLATMAAVRAPRSRAARPSVCPAALAWSGPHVAIGSSRVRDRPRACDPAIPRRSAARRAPTTVPSPLDERPRRMPPWVDSSVTHGTAPSPCGRRRSTANSVERATPAARLDAPGRAPCRGSKSSVRRASNVGRRCAGCGGAGERAARRRRTTQLVAPSSSPSSGDEHVDQRRRGVDLEVAPAARRAAASTAATAGVDLRRPAGGVAPRRSTAPSAPTGAAGDGRRRRSPLEHARRASASASDEHAAIRRIARGSRLHHDGHDHRPALGALVDELAGGAAHVALERVDVAHARRPAPARPPRRPRRTPRRAGPRPRARTPSRG